MRINELVEVNKTLLDTDILEMESGVKSFKLPFVKLYEYIRGKLNLASVAFTGRFADLTGIPDLPTRGYIDQQDQNTLALANNYSDTKDQEVRNSITQLSGSLSDVAFSGNYSDLVGAPNLTQYPTTVVVDQKDAQTLDQAKAYTDSVVVAPDLTGYVTKNQFDLTVQNIEGEFDGVQDTFSQKVDKQLGKGLSANDFTDTLKDKVDGIQSGATRNQTDSYLLNRDNHTGMLPREVLPTASKTLKGGVIAGDYIGITSSGEISVDISDVIGAINVEFEVPTKTSQLENDSGFITEEVDPTVPSWAKQPEKPVYTKDEVGLGNVNNTSDASKPISDATALALGNKVDRVLGKQLSTEDFTTAEKDKLSLIAPEATKNATDASLRDRATHTGVQPISSVTGLQTALDGKADTGDIPDISNLATKQEVEDLDSSLSPVAKSGDYGDLSNTPTLGSASEQDVSFFATAGQGALADTAVQPDDLIPYALGADVPQSTDELPAGANNKYVTQAELDKLAGLESSHYKGLYTTLTGLISSVTSPVAGDYADVDEGVGSDILRYIWDESDSQWVPQAGESAPITAPQVKSLYESNPNTNAFTDTEKDKLSGIADGATVNATNAQLRDRATHTGSQAISTITGLQTALDGKAATSYVDGLTTISADAGNSLERRGNGLYAAASGVGLVCKNGFGNLTTDDGTRFTGAFSTYSANAATSSSGDVVAIGRNASAGNSETITIGSMSSTTRLGGIAIGKGSTSSAGESISIGWNAASSGNESVSIGSWAEVTGMRSVSIGYRSTSKRNSSDTSGVADSVSVGSGISGIGASTRQIINVSAPTHANDAVSKIYSDTIRIVTSQSAANNVESSGSLVVGVASLTMSNQRTGFRLDIKGPTTVAVPSGHTIDSIDSNTSVTASGGATLIKTGTTTWWLVGNLGA